MAHGAPGDDGELQKGLKQRHLTMIAIGGVIGAGLFVGSGAIIKEVGPAAYDTGTYPQARALFEQVALDDDFVDFLTLPAYDLID